MVSKITDFVGKMQAAEKPRMDLQTPPFKIGANPNFTRHTETMTLKLKERKFTVSLDDFAVTDAYTNETVFDVDAKAFSLRSKRRFRDAAGQPVYTLTRTPLSFHQRFEGLNEDTNDLMFSVTSHFAFGMTRYKISFKNWAHEGEETELQVFGDMAGHFAEISIPDGPVIGQIRQSFLNSGEILFDQQSYYLVVAPGVDVSMLCAAVIVLDELEHELKQNKENKN
ncbi:hypothetical protein CF327_g6021 [Tilletia walkeri]|nr:hypothetical protein CF327_g6021 [Tilletia walkeri]